MKRARQINRCPSIFIGFLVCVLAFFACSTGSLKSSLAIPPASYEGGPTHLPIKISWISTLDRAESEIGVRAPSQIAGGAGTQPFGGAAAAQYERNIFQIDFHPIEFSTPITDEKKVFVGTSSKRFFALSRDSGKVLWQFDSFGAVESTAALFSDKVVFGDSDGMVYCLNAQTGLLKWSFKSVGEIMGRVLIVQGKAIFMTTYNRLYALNAETGEWLWMHQRDVPGTFTVRGAASPVAYSEKILAGFSDGYIVAVNLKDGKEVWKNLLKIDEQLTDVDSTPVIEGDSIFVSAYDGALYKLNAEDGNVKWKLPMAGSVSPPVVVDRYLFVSASTGFVLAVDKETGKKQWEVDIRQADKEKSLAGGPRRAMKIPSAPVLMGDTLLTGSSQGYLYAIDPQTGTIRWKYFPGNGLDGGIAINGRSIYFLGNGGFLFAMRASEHPSASF